MNRVSRASPSPPSNAGVKSLKATNIPNVMRAELYIGPIHASQELEDHRRQDVGAATNAYSTRGPARQPISQKSVSSRVASLKIAISSASRAGVA